MKVLLISTAVFPVPPERYGGVEVLVNEFCGELVNLGVEVSLAAPKGSSPPKGCELIETVDLRFHKGFGGPEEVAYYNYVDRLREFDVVHDFSHGKYASFANPLLPSLNVCWFEPVWFTEQRGGQPHPMPHNVVALSRYQADRFRLVYGRQVRHQPTICRDSNVYRPSKHRDNRFLFVGKMSWHKGCLEAIKYCRELGLPLDICGGFGAGDPPYYMNSVLNECDGEQICFYPNVLDIVKIRLMRHAKAVLYPVQFTESHNMVLVEAMLCGTPVITFNKGAMSEVVEHGVTGYIANSDDEFKEFMLKVDLDPKVIRRKAILEYSKKVVVKNYLELYRQVAEGTRW